MDILKVGSSGQSVTDLQNLLNTVDNAGLTVDGSFGPNVQKAVMNFQSGHGITADGVAGPQTIGLLQILAGKKVATTSITTLLTVNQIQQIFPTLAASKVAANAAAINQALVQFGIDTPRRLACFLANVAVETSNLNVLEENLNYSAVGLANTWPGRFGLNGKRGVPNDYANSLAKKPQAIANAVYGMQNGNNNTGDGWLFRGRGPVMLTFLNNYKLYAGLIGIDIVTNPDQVASIPVGMLVAAAYWKTNNINRYADVLDFDGVCDMINVGHKTAAYGDSIGFEDRATAFARIRKIFQI